jgi:RimJ/RimL family protein N-acetyltransferase
LLIRLRSTIRATYFDPSRKTTLTAVDKVNVRIVEIRQEHAIGFNRVYDSVARERKYLAALEGHPLERTEAFVANNIAKNYPQFVACAGDEIIGWCDVIPMALPAHAHVGVLGMGLLSAFRAQGIGRALLDATIKSAQAFGLVRIELTVHADNVPALALYSSIGFVKEGIKKDAVLIDGVFKDVVMMALVKGKTALPDARTKGGTLYLLRTSPDAPRHRPFADDREGRPVRRISEASTPRSSVVRVDELDAGMRRQGEVQL